MANGVTKMYKIGDLVKANPDAVGLNLFKRIKGATGIIYAVDLNCYMIDWSNYATCRGPWWDHELLPMKPSNRIYATTLSLY